MQKELPMTNLSPIDLADKLQMHQTLLNSPSHLLPRHFWKVESDIEGAEGSAWRRPNNPVWVVGFNQNKGILSILSLRKVPIGTIVFGASEIQSSEPFDIEATLPRLVTQPATAISLVEGDSGGVGHALVDK